MASKGKVVIVGGHGQIALGFTKLASKEGYKIVSIIRNANQSDTIKSVGGEPLVLSMESSSSAELTPHFAGASHVLFAAGAGGKGGEERTKAVDYDGAIKTFDAIEGLEGGKEKRPRCLYISAIDLRDTSKPAPAYYDEADMEASRKIRAAIPAYMKWKREADLELAKRNGFNWTILKPGGLTGDPGTGKITIGRTHLKTVSREDVSATLFELLSHPEANGIALDLINGETPIQEAVKGAIERKEYVTIG